MALAEDLSLFFDVDEFAVTVTLASGETIAAIFDRAFIESMGGQIDGDQPMCLVQTSDVSVNGIVFGSTVTLPDFGEHAYGWQSLWGGSILKVKSIQPDGTGLSLLVFEEA